MRKDNKIPLKDVLNAAYKIDTFAQNLTREQFLETQELLKDGIIRNFEIIGEASRRLDKDFENKHPEYPLRDAITMRNKVIHEYEEVDYELVWDTMQQDIPHLIKITEKILREKS